MPRSLRRFSSAVFVLAACAIPPKTVTPAGLHSPFTGYSSALYRDDKMWLCRPDIRGDICHSDAGATELRADGTRVVIPSAPPVTPKVDCFYVYPTVDLALVPDNHTDFEALEPVEDATRSQASPFRDVCALYVPLYRQLTIGSYIFSEEARERRSEVAFSDVKDAFLHYMGQYNHGRKVVLIGHSQGADMVVRLLKALFQEDPVMMGQLLVAMPIGGPVEVRKGKLVGGTFESIPLCSNPDELGCVVAFQSRPASGMVGKPVFQPRPGNVTACVNPAPAGELGIHRFSRALFPINHATGGYLTGVEGVQTPFVMMRDFYTAACVEGFDGYAYLAIAAGPRDGDKRVSLLDLTAARFNGVMGLHIADVQFAMGDLVDLVARKAAHAP